jgi:hypothetical protein
MTHGAAYALTRLPMRDDPRRRLLAYVATNRATGSETLVLVGATLPVHDQRTDAQRLAYRAFYPTRRSYTT